MRPIGKWSLVLTSIFLITFSIQADVLGQQSDVRMDRSICRSGGAERRVEIVYFDQVRGVPCEVHYYKDSDESGQSQILWRAENQAGFCEKKLTEFVDKLSGLGWNCRFEEDVPPALRQNGTPKAKTSSALSPR